MRTSDKRYYLKALPEGCRKCARGAKMVLLVTGLCPRRCYYCPLSGEKAGRDVVYANEGRVRTDEEVIREARSMRALGTGITGGEPLMVPDRTKGFIRLLKKEFGPKHHIHLYTTGEFDPRLVGELSRAGLDEIRFHPPPGDWTGDDPAFLPAFKRALRTRMDVGIEVPAIPGMHRELIELAERYFGMGMAFLNLNELEASETNWDQLCARAFGTLVGDSHAVKGSKATALRVLRALDGKGLRVNFCTSVYKDAVQLRRRLLRRARSVGRPYQLVTRDATFYFGVVEPGGMDMTDFRLVMTGIMKEFHVPRSLYGFQDGRMELAPWVLEELAREIPFKRFLVETYPSVDALEVERTPI